MNIIPTALTMAVLLLATTAHSTTVEELSGKFAIRTLLKNSYLSARPGNHTINALVTDKTPPLYFEDMFRFQRVQPTNLMLIKTGSNYFVSAAGGGGRGGNYDAANTLQTERTSPADDALFRLQFDSGTLAYTIKTLRGYYLTALGGGGKSTNAFHTDATRANTWESFQITKCGSLGTGHNYIIKPRGSSRPLSPLAPQKVANADAVFRLTQIDPYGHQVFYRGQPINQGVIKFVERVSCTYTMQTYHGSYLGVDDRGWVTNTIVNPDAAINKPYNAYFELIPIF